MITFGRILSLSQKEIIDKGEFLCKTIARNWLEEELEKAIKKFPEKDFQIELKVIDNKNNLSKDDRK